MQKRMISIIKKLFVASIVFAFSLFDCVPINGETISKNEHPEPRLYELHNSSFDDFFKKEIFGFSFGKPSLGSLSISGNIYDKARGEDKIIAYAVKSDICIGYQYSGGFQTNNKENWNLSSDDKSKAIDGFELSKKIKSGVVLVFKYSLYDDGWYPVAEYYDFFKKYKNGKDDLYSVTKDEVAGGALYRVIVGYKMAKSTGNHTSGWNVPLINHEVGGKDEYEYIHCCEMYDFWLYSDSPAVAIKDINDGNKITADKTIDSGFALRRMDPTSLVNITYSGNSVVLDEADQQIFTAPGKYTISTTSVFGDTKTTTINVNEGISLYKMNADMYVSKKNKGFVGGEKLSKQDTEDAKLTDLYIGGNQIEDASFFKQDGFDAYAIKGPNAAVYLQFRYNYDDLMEGYEITYDKWGAKEKEKIYGVNTGEIGTGALIVQTSKDGVNWSNPNNGRYSSGLYTKDMFNHYQDGHNILIYTPDGKDIINGIYIRVCYVYQTKYDGGLFDKDTEDTLEEYKFYLCSNEIDAVTFQNLTLSSNLAESHVDEDINSSAAYKLAETLTDGSMTVTGFAINKELNPNVKFVVRKNGETIPVPSNNTFTENGKYTIELQNATGEKKTTTIYIDNSSNENAMRDYFGNAFLDGKRVFSANEYPTFEGGSLYYHIAAKDSTMPPMQGTIENLTTGKKITVLSKNIEQSSKITDPGEYEAIFRIGKTAGSETDDSKASGDYRKFTFHFTVIKEGTAPGPQVNREILNKHTGLTASDYYPIYYGVTYPSAGPGNITVAFADKEAAVHYAAAYEQGVVEKQEDGTYRYRGSLNVAQKEEYKDLWQLTDATNYFAEQAVEKLYFDVSDQFTICTLPEDVLETTKNLRTLELKNSVVVFSDAVQRETLSKNGGTPLITDKKMVYLAPGMDGKVTAKDMPFEFIKDKYGYDSSSVKIIDTNGKEYSLDYRKSVEDQLAANNCPSGIVKIQEENIYGETTSYDALYIAKGENKAKIQVNYVENGSNKTATFTSSDNGATITASEFTIGEIVDELDPHSLVIIEGTNIKEVFVANESSTYQFKDKGQFKITAVNRMGYKFSFSITIK